VSASWESESSIEWREPQRMKKMFYAKIAMRGACTESPREWLNTRLRQGYGGQAAGAYLVQAPECHALTLGEGRAVPPVYPRACGGTPSFTQIAFFAEKYSVTIWPSYRQATAMFNEQTAQKTVCKKKEIRE